ncbi:MAG: DUF3306 domain-containing protein [Casimicrobiaceae bacterium]
MSDKPADDERGPERLSLRRWSQRKLETARAPAPPAQTAPGTEGTAPDGAASATQAAGPATPPATAALPPIESLTIDSEYAPFFKPHVAEATRRAALKQLFRDPRFNIMDGLDVYIGDYTQPDPIPPEMMKQLAHVRHIFDPPRTEVNAEGYVVDVVDEVVPATVAGPADAVAATARTVAVASAALQGRAPGEAEAAAAGGSADKNPGAADS